MKVCVVLKDHGFRALYLGIYTSFESAIRCLSAQFNNDGSVEVVEESSLPDVTFLNGEKFTIFIDTVQEGQMSDLRVIHMTYDEFYNKKYVDQIPCLMLFQEDEGQSLRFVIGATAKDDINFYDYGFAIKDSDYYGPNGNVSKDEFLDIIKSDFPEWFDWFLFNPGWF